MTIDTNTNNKINILIIDDERLAINYLKDIINETIIHIPILKEASIITCQNPKQADIYIKNYLPIIIFLDIEMPQISGIELAKLITENKYDFGYSKEQHFPAIIFSTAFENYGYQAFQTEAIDYVLKPVDTDRIKNCLLKFKQFYQKDLKILESYLIVNNNGIDVKIYLKEILYLKAEEKYITVKTDKKEFLITDSLMQLEQKYTELLKIHRSYLVNPTYIQRFYKKDNLFYVLLKNNESLSVSRRQKQELHGKLDYSLFSSIEQDLH